MADIDAINEVTDNIDSIAKEEEREGTSDAAADIVDSLYRHEKDTTRHLCAGFIDAFAHKI